MQFRTALSSVIQKGFVLRLQVEKDAHYIKSEAVLRIAKGLGLPLWVVAQAMLVSPKFVRDAVYDQVRAFNRRTLVLHW
jgi:predicted DCC family thiol-disulfide oxidoreductase YuxK